MKGNRSNMGQKINCVPKEKGDFHCKKTTSHLAHKSANMPQAQTHSAWKISTATCRGKKHSVAVESVHAE